MNWCSCYLGIFYYNFKLGKVWDTSIEWVLSFFIITFDRSIWQFKQNYYVNVLISRDNYYFPSQVFINSFKQSKCSFSLMF